MTIVKTQDRIIVMDKPLKKTDKDLNDLILKRIASRDYVFLNHAKQRQKERNISDMDVLNILENQKGYKRKRVKVKDKYERDKADWNYCYEGRNCDAENIRIIISFGRGCLQFARLGQKLLILEHCSAVYIEVNEQRSTENQRVMPTIVEL